MESIKPESGLELKIDSSENQNNNGISKRMFHNVVRYAKRYGIAELAATGASTAAPCFFPDNDVHAAYAANFSGYAAFFGTIVAQDIYVAWKQSKEEERDFSVKDIAKMAGGMINEFGVSTCLDMFITRPYILEKTIGYFGSATGGFIGKWVADVPFLIMSDLSRRFPLKEKVRKISSFFRNYKRD